VWPPRGSGWSLLGTENTDVGTTSGPNVGEEDNYAELRASRCCSRLWWGTLRPRIDYPVGWDDLIVRHEIFGPVLPILT
jgi:hypothetical protein